MPAQQIQPQDAGQANKLFEQGFADMANRVLASKYPNLANDVVTFKVLAADVNAGSAVGAFVVLRGGQTIYIPGILSDNQLKPLDLMYVKDRNIFLPLTKDWLAKVEQLNSEYLGSPGKPPKTMSTDVDIRNVVIPPTTGRYSYAALADGSDVREMFAQAQVLKPDNMVGSYLNLISGASNAMKTASLKFFERNPHLFARMISHYGETKVAAAFAQRVEAVKVANAAEMSPTNKLLIADQSTTPGQFKAMFGPQSAIAFQGVKLKGYYAQDGRTKHNKPVLIQETVRLSETKDGGVYKLWCVHGNVTPALVINDPIEILPSYRGEHGQTGTIGKRVKVDRYHATHRLSPNVNDDHGVGCCAPVSSSDMSYVGVTEKGKLIKSRQPLMGEPGVMDDLTKSPIFNKAVGESSAQPRTGQTGFFMLVRAGRFTATRPVKIRSVSTDSEGLTVVKIGYPEGETWKDDEREATVLYGSSKGGRILATHPGAVPTRVPADTIWVATTGEGLEASDFCRDMKSINQMASAALTRAGASPLVVKKSSQHGYMFGEDSRQGYNYVGALRKLALDANISVADAEMILDETPLNGRQTVYSIPLNKIAAVRAAFDKIADAAQPGQPPPQGAPAPADPSQDPAGAAMAQVPMAPQAPAMPSPIDMAVAEQMQNLQSQMQGIQAQMQTLQAVQDRANAIAGSGGAINNPAAAAASMAGPMDPSMMGAGGAPGQPPAAGQPAPAPAAQPAPQGAPMPQGQPAQPGMGAAPTGQPNAAAQAPQAPQGVMTADAGDPASMMSQVNPQFADQVSQLQDAGMFDTGMLGSMAQTPALRDMVGAYLPNLEKALDNSGRMLLTLWMDEGRIKEDVGDEAYVALETNMRSAQRTLGDLILKVNQTSSVLRGPNDRNLEV